MDSFEALVRLLLERDGYWTRQSEKIELSPDEKASFGKRTAPRPELDIVALNQNRNLIIAMEVKSFLDSRGVSARDFYYLDMKITKGKYKLFTSPNYRELVKDRLLESYRRQGLADKNTSFQLGLAAGKIRGGDESELAEIFKRTGWLLWTPQVLSQKARSLADIGYENDPFVLIAKLLERNPKS